MVSITTSSDAATILEIENPVAARAFLPSTPLFSGEQCFDANATSRGSPRARPAAQRRAVSPSIACWRHKAPVIFRAHPAMVHQPWIRRDCARVHSRPFRTWTVSRLGDSHHRQIAGRPDCAFSRQAPPGACPSRCSLQDQRRTSHRVPRIDRGVAESRLERDGIDAWFDA